MLCQISMELPRLRSQLGSTAEHSVMVIGKRMPAGEVKNNQEFSDFQFPTGKEGNPGYTQKIHSIFKTFCISLNRY